MVDFGQRRVERGPVVGEGQVGIHGNSFLKDANSDPSMEVVQK
jgi:hypothetical protein